MALLINIIAVVIVLGLVLYLISQLPVDPTMKQIAHVVILVAVILWLLGFLLGGGFSFLGPLRLCP